MGMLGVGGGGQRPCSQAPAVPMPPEPQLQEGGLKHRLQPDLTGRCCAAFGLCLLSRSPASHGGGSSALMRWLERMS